MIYTITLNPAIDRLLYLEEKMESRKSNRIREVTYDIGGKGTHGSYVMSQLDVHHLALGFMGDMNGEKFKKILKAKHINDDFTVVRGQATRECYIIIDRHTTGTTMLTEKGLTVNENDKHVFIENLKVKVKQDDIVLIAGSLPINFTMDDLRKLIEVLKEAGCFIACDLSGEALKLAVEMAVDFIKPNEFELNELNSTNENTIDYLKSLNNKIHYIVASLGEKGSYCVHDKKVYRVLPPKVKEVNDTGAGDCFVGAFLSGLYKNLSIQETLKLASACAASKVMHHDSSTFSLEDALRMKEQVKITEI